MKFQCDGWNRISKNREACAVSELLKKRSLTPSPQNLPQKLEGYPSYPAFGAPQIMDGGRCCVERPTEEPPLLTSFAAQSWCDFGLDFKFGNIWAQWQHGAGALGSLDAQRSHPPYNDVGQLDGVSMSLNASSSQERLDNHSWPNCKEGGNEVPKHRDPVPDALRLSKTSLRGWQTEAITSRRHTLHSSWWSRWVHRGISDVSEHLCFHPNSTPGPADCGPVVAHTSVVTGTN